MIEGLKVRTVGEGTADPFRKLPALADRLGVPELTDEDRALGGLTIISTQDNRHYDLFALIEALLDRLETRQ